jgi:IstB-like ATP binding protein
MLLSCRDAVDPSAEANERRGGPVDVPDPVQQATPAPQRPRVGQMPDRLLHQGAQPGLASDLVTPLQTAHLEGNAGAKMRTFTGPSVLVVDELGYLPMDQTSAHWVFQVVSRRYERGSIVLTSNRGFSDWGAVFADQVVAAAILDRLLHHATVINIKGKSYRMRRHANALDQSKERPML